MEFPCSSTEMDENLMPLDQVPSASSKIVKISKPLIQKPSLPPSLLNYVFKNASYSLIQKLYSTCKYFPKKYPYLVLTQLSIQPKEDGKEVFEYRQRSLRLTLSHHEAAKLKNLYIVTTFSFQNANRSSLHALIVPKIHRCEARFIDLWNQDLSWADFQVIVSSKYAQQIYLEDVNIGNDDKNFPLEKVLEHCCNATSVTVNHIKSSNIVCTGRTSTFLADLNLSSKLKTFCIGGLNESLDPSDFCAFLKANAAPVSRFTLSFKSLPSRQYCDKFKEQLNITMQLWWPRRDKPILELKNM